MSNIKTDLTEILFDSRLGEKVEEIEMLINRIKAGEITLSFSALQAFRKSPKHFLQYKLKKRVTTDAMFFGSIVHCMTLEPDEFPDTYFVTLPDDQKPSNQSKSALKFCKLIADGVHADIAIQLSVSNAGKTETTRRKKYEPLLAKYSLYIDWLKKYNEWLKARSIQWYDPNEKESKTNRRTLVSLEGPNSFEEGVRLRNEVWNNEVSSPYIASIMEAEKKVRWTEKGYKFFGIIDGIGHHFKFGNFIMDFKKVQDASPRIFEPKIYWKQTHEQLAMYRHGANLQNHDCLVIAVDNHGFVGVYPLSEDFVRLGEQEYRNTLNHFRKCQFLNQWKSGYEFWSTNEYGTFYSDVPYWKQHNLKR